MQPEGTSYRRSDFLRLFSGGYVENGDYDEVTAFVGTTATVAGNHTLPEVFGSVRAYYDSVSNGAFQLHARLINPAADNQDHPRWVELPETKGHYAEIDGRDHQVINGQRQRDLFWDHAYDAAWDSVRCWSPRLADPTDVDCGDSEVSDYPTDIQDLPNSTYGLARRRRHKVVYLYSGVTYVQMDRRINNRIRRAANPNARDRWGLLHPQVDVITDTTPTRARQVGYRYVMGEREGWGHNDHDIDEFAGIFTHAHEIGHLLGLIHGGGQWSGPNPYRPLDVNLPRATYTNSAGANLLQWGLMQGTGAGPDTVDNGYYTAYRSCPNPINPFYRWDPWDG